MKSMTSAADRTRQSGDLGDRSSVEKLVLATVNAPFQRDISATVLGQCIAQGRIDEWSVHIATFFTDVSPHLVFRFASHHGISRSKLAETYLAMKTKTGERNPDLESELVTLAPSPR
jgi:hypothetical protein